MIFFSVPTALLLIHSPVKLKSKLFLLDVAVRVNDAGAAAVMSVPFNQRQQQQQQPRSDGR